MEIWTFKVFISLGGRDTFDEWIKSLDINAQERIRGIIRHMSVTRRWGRPFFDAIHGYEGIHEIRVKAKNIQYRPLGCFGPGPQTFTLLLGASKKVNVWFPKDAIKMAVKRRKLIFENRRYLGEYKP